MRLLIPAVLAATLLIPAAAQACDKCIYHGTARENAAWDAILTKPKQVKLAEARPATASVKVTPAQRTRK